MTDDAPAGSHVVTQPPQSGVTTPIPPTSSRSEPRAQVEFTQSTDQLTRPSTPPSDAPIRPGALGKSPTDDSLIEAQPQAAATLKPLGPGTSQSSESLDSQLSELLSNALGGHPLTGAPTAPVIVPDQSQLRLTLVPLHLFERLEDSYSDRAVVSALLWTLVGLAGGLLISSLQDFEATTGSTWALLGVFVVACGLSAIYLWRLNERYKRIVKPLKDQEKGPAK